MSRRLRPWAALGLAVGVGTVAPAPASAQWEWVFGGRNSWAPVRHDYPLDAIPRRGTSTDVCQPEIMVPYRGEQVRLNGTVRVHPAFRERLPDLERVIHEVATEIYGRPPHRVLHAGAFNCRLVRGSRYGRLSEHALGNALDVRGFEFRALPRRAERPADLPRSLRSGFTVTVERHWEASDERGRVHARFLRRLIDRLVEEDVFRVIYGPAHPGHHNHFHFDMSPFRWIHV